MRLSENEINSIKNAFFEYFDKKDELWLFAKLQDTIGNKIFPLLLKMLQEYRPEESFLDRLHKLEKLNIIDSIAYWNRFREVRNSIAHDYPETSEITIIALNECAKMCIELLHFWEKLKVFINSQSF